MDKQAIIRALRDTTQSASNAIASNVSGPVDLLAAALRGVGMPIPEDAMGGSKWMADRGLTKEVPMGAPRIIGETLGMAGPAVAAAKAPQIAAGLNQMQANAMAPTTLSKQAGALFVTEGLPNRGRDLIQSESERLADMLNSQGFKASLEHSGSAAGPSSYIRLSDPETGRFFTKDIRLSGHPKGAFNSQAVWDVNSSEFGDVLDAAKNMRGMGKSKVILMQEKEKELIASGVRPKQAAKQARDIILSGALE